MGGGGRRGKGGHFTGDSVVEIISFLPVAPTTGPKQHRNHQKTTFAITRVCE